MSEGRSIWRMIFDNFRKSLTLLPSKGKLVGKDNLGNSYFEGRLNVNSRRQSVPRWFEPEIKDDWQQNLPAEWEAWLRGRRQDPPSEEEIMKNLALAKVKKIKGDEIEANFHDPKKEKASGGFPKFEEYQRDPGAFKEKK